VRFSTNARESCFDCQSSKSCVHYLVQHDMEKWPIAFPTSNECEMVNNYREGQEQKEGLQKAFLLCILV
jgi:hypothetical protein